MVVWPFLSRSMVMVTTFPSSVNSLTGRSAPAASRIEAPSRSPFFAILMARFCSLPF